MIEATNLSKRFGRLEAVRNLSFFVDDGQVVGLLGPNGAGKTTTMRLLTTFLPPSGGTAKVAGLDIRTQSEQVRRNIGYLPEIPPLYPEMKVRDYLRFVASIKGVPSAQIASRVAEVIERCSLRPVETRLCSQISRGFRQRVGIAQALVHRPKVIILDEPTAGLDPAQIIEIRRLIAELRTKHTVVLSTHILPEVTETCDRVIIIAHGEVVVEGSVKDLTKEKTLEQSFLDAVSDDIAVASEGEVAR